MTASVRVSFLPFESSPDSFDGCAAVIIDVLRASTTIIAALFNGAAAVVPCLTVDEAQTFRETRANPDQRPLLGGERGGIKIQGFNLSNSPQDYTCQAVEGRLIGFTTTNGTRALLHCRNADVVIIGSFVNFTSVRNFLLQTEKSVCFVCAGTDGEVTGEDVLFAGMMVSALMGQGSMTKTATGGGSLRPSWIFTDSAQIAASYWRLSCLPDRSYQDPDSEAIRSALRKTRGGRNLLSLGYGDDIEFCGQVDAFPVLPRYSADQNRIELWDR